VAAVLAAPVRRLAIVVQIQRYQRSHQQVAVVLVTPHLEFNRADLVAVVLLD
jgi:hypothetical protein